LDHYVNRCFLISVLLGGTGREWEEAISLRDYESAESAGCDLGMERIEGGLFWRRKGFVFANFTIVISMK